MKRLLARVLLNVAIWAFDRFYKWVDKDDDGKLSRKELMDKAHYLDKATRNVYGKLKKKFQ